ncbi:MAG TPA: ABC transporter permease [Acidimicrobiales bacterium]|nr:ABC transporter permease [Acidimicrobiales bacterium]
MSAGSGRLLRPERLKELSLLAVIGVTILVFTPLVDGYLSGRFFNRVSTSVTIIAVLAVAQTLVIITRNIDLSLGSIVGVTAYVTGQFVAAHPDVTPVAGVGLAILIGAGLGCINGVLVAYGRVPAIVVTLGTLAIYRSWLIEYANARTITTDELPSWVADLPRTTVASWGDLDLRLVFVVALIVVVVLQATTAKLRWGRWLYAIGSNPDAARQMGLPHRRLVLSAFVGSGALAGLAGFLFLARFGTINVTAGQGFELDSVAAAVVGGASILGGTGSFVGALLGAVLIDLLDQSLVRVEAVTEFYRNAILGALILLAVIGDAGLSAWFRRRRASEARPAVGTVPSPAEATPAAPGPAASPIPDHDEEASHA